MQLQAPARARLVPSAPSASRSSICEEVARRACPCHGQQPCQRHPALAHAHERLRMPGPGLQFGTAAGKQTQGKQGPHQAKAVFSAPSMAPVCRFCWVARWNISGSTCGSSATNIWYTPDLSWCLTCSVNALARSWKAIRSAASCTPAAVTEQSPKRPSVSSANSLAQQGICSS